MKKGHMVLCPVHKDPHRPDATCPKCGSQRKAIERNTRATISKKMKEKIGETEPSRANGWRMAGVGVSPERTFGRRLPDNLLVGRL